MTYRILAINPGSTSTKIAGFEDEKEIFNETLRHNSEELQKYEKITDQWDFRRQLVVKALKKRSIDLESFAAFACRGGLVRPIPSGTYRVSEAMVEDCRSGVFGQHASNLGALIGHELELETGIPAFVTDPPAVDELSDEARISGHPLIQRSSMFHALNQKAVVRRYASEAGKRYEDMNLLVCHMGGGVSVGAHRRGLVVDTENAVGGEGPLTPTRAGSMPVNEIIRLCFSGQYTKEEIDDMMTKSGGVFAYTGTANMEKVIERASNGEEEARKILDAFCYQVAKEIAAMAVALGGRADQIILTGGIAYSETITGRVRELTEWIAPVTVYPGEDEMLSLAQGALRVLRGEEEAKIYQP